jgi:hypothetical protein
MIRIPLPRLLERLAEQVDGAPLDPAADPYEFAQMQAAAEILRNLAARVQWIPEETAPGGVPAEGADLGAHAARQLERELGRLVR